jgi:TonB-dependent SusC/RagA subfamily outer membrane receptor
MATKFSISLLLVLSFFLPKAQTTDTIFKNEWIRIDTLIIKQNQPKTALSLVNEVYVKAKKQQLQPQIIKCLVYRLSLEDRIFDNKPNNAISILENEIAVTKDEAAKSILYCLLANRYQQYYNNNRWKYYNRSKTTNFSKADIETWNADDFNEAITKNYLASVANAFLLKTAKLEDFDAIIIKGNTRKLRPALYDILVHEALDYFKTGDYYITKPAYAFELKDIKTLSTSNEFITEKFESKDSTAHQLIALHLFQDLIAYHINDADKNAFIHVDIERIQWVNTYLTNDKKEEKYLNTLSYLSNFSFNAAAQASYLLAKNKFDKATTYKPFDDSSNRYAFVQTLKMIDVALLKFSDESEGRTNLLNLKNQILEKKISTQTEKVNVLSKPFRALVNYKNVDTVFVRIIKVDQTKKDLGNNFNRDFERYSKLQAFKIFYQVLPKTNDYQNHSAEIKIDALPTGTYMLLSSSGAGFIDSLDEMSKQYFYVSNISYIKNGNDYFVLNRESGKPLASVITNIYKDEWSSSANKNYRNLVETKKTDKNGYFNFKPKDNYGNFYFEFTAKNDALFLDNSDYIYRSYSNNNDDNEYDKNEIEDYEIDKAKIFFFTDRSIYRPGQTVYFKGIGITKDLKTKTEKVFIPRDSIKVFLLDANDDEIDSLSFKANDYGSFSGNFKIPQNVLTGSFKIEAADFDNSEKSFLVEEYKRPKFYVEFEKVKGSYKINDSITVTGIAKAYAGNFIDNASVKFTVNRNARFIYDWYWRGGYRPRSSNTVITDSIIKTDASGKFNITFKTIPDEAVDKNTDPLFDFSITADVTDTNGETRNSNTTVTVGYKSLILNLTAPSIAMADSSQQIFIATKNLSNEKEPAEVKIKIYSVTTPNRLIRKRYWQQPDQHIFTKEQYIQHFPYDDYADELNEKKWAASKEVYSTILDTKKDASFTLNKSQLPVGYYKIEATTKDKEGNEIKDVKYMQLFNKQATAYPQYNFKYTLNNLVQPTETATFLRGSMANEIFVIQEVQNKNIATDSYTFNQYKKGITALKYTATEKDRGNIGINEAYIIHNRVYTNQYTVQVPWSNKELQVNYTSFRNKTEPGNKETYTVNIKGNKGEKVAAELLTTMYDASLEQFVKHELVEPTIWKVNYYGNEFSYNNGWSANTSINNFKITNTRNYFITNRYDRIAKNASDLYRLANDFLMVVMKKEGDLNEVVVTGYSKMQRKTVTGAATMISSKELTGKVSGLNVQASSLEKTVVVGYGNKNTSNSLVADMNPDIRIRGNSTTTGTNSIYIVDGFEMSDNEFKKINVDDIESIYVLKDKEALSLYGARAANGVIIITTKAGAKKKEQQQAVKPRKNFKETAFFFPNLYADTAGNYTFSFTIPEALTQWKWLSFAHTKDLAFGINSATITTQKTLMVQPNAPRFMREGDNMEFVTKIANLSDKELTGQCTLELVDATTGASVDGWFQNSFPVQYFTAAANQSTVVKFPVQIPFNYNKPLTWRVIAKAAEFSDGEENTLPVLTNRMLVTESLPLYLKSGEKEKNYSFDKLLNNKSESLAHEGITVEYTANPIWSVVQSLPYLMEYPYECAEQTFNRMYANALASSIVNKYPKIKAVFEEWKKDTTAFKSNLQKNEELKQVLLQETPWVLNAETEQQKQKNIALLFDVVKMSNSIDAVIEKLQQLQTSNGGFAWFKGGYESRYITNYILTGIGKLKKANALSKGQADKLQSIADKALTYMDEQLLSDYNEMIKNKIDLTKNNLYSTQIQYLYMRSFYTNNFKNKTAYNYYYNQAKQYWNKQNTYNTALIGLTLYRNNERRFVNVNLIPSILENAVEDTAKGTLYWKDRTACFWYASPIEHQSIMIECLSEIQQQENFAGFNAKIDAAKTWLILNKQTNNWKTTVATAEACYALLNTGTDWINNSNEIQIKLGSTTINSQTQTPNSKQIVGYLKERIPSDKVKPAMGNITIQQSANSSIQQSSPSYGAIYWQYFEDMDKITAASSPLSLKKKLFVEKNTDKGKVLQPVNENDELKVGDKIVVRIELSSNRTMEYLHLKDMRASGTEPINVLSSYKWQDGLGYYEATKDASTNFFIDRLEKGSYVFEYPLYVTDTGTFSVGIANIQCMYAPEFTSHSEGIKIKVVEQLEIN